MLVTISFVSVVGKQTSDYKEKETPLFRYKISKRVGEKLDEVKARRLQNRIFLRLPDVELNDDGDFEPLISGRTTCPTIQASWECYTIIWGIGCFFK